MSFSTMGLIFILAMTLLMPLVQSQGAQNTTAAPGTYLNSGNTSLAPLPCPVGQFCRGGTSQPLPCTCAAACPSPGTASDPWGLVWTVTTFAGSGLTGTVNGVGTAASFTSLFGMGIDVQRGMVFISTNPGGVIRRVDPLGMVTTYAGSTTTGFLDGVGAGALLNTPQSSAFDPLTQLLFFADVGNNRLRAVSPTGLVSTIAGSGVSGTVNGVGTNARFAGMSGAAVDEVGNIYASCFGAFVIRKITAGTYVVTTLAGTGVTGYADGAGALAQFKNPWDLDASRDGSGLLYVADQGNNRIRVVDTTNGATTTLAGQTVSGTADTPTSGLALGGSTPLGWNAQFIAPTSVVWAPSGALMVQDFTAGCRLRMVSSTTGAVVTIAGSPSATCGYADGTGQSVLFSPIVGVAMDVNGTVYVADNGNLRLRKATCSLCPLGSYCLQGSPYPCPAGRFGGTPGLTTPACSGPCTAAEGWGCPAGSTSAGGVICPAQSFCPGGSSPPLPCTCPTACPTPGTPRDPLALVWNVSTLSGSGVSIWADGVGTAASWGSPNGAASIAATGLVFTSDNSVRRIRVTTPGGAVTTLAGSGIAGNADGAGAAASFQAPASIALAPSGLLYVVEGNPGNRLRSITPLGLVTSVAGVAGSAGWQDGPCATALFSNPNGVAVFTSLPGTASVVGVTTVFVAENSGHRVRAVTTTTPCMVSTLAGSPLGTAGFADGLGFAALFNQPWGLDADPVSGTLYVGDWLNNRVRSVSPIGMVSTLAGSGAVGGVDGLGAAAVFSAPVDVTFIPSGQLLVSDFSGHRVRLVDAGSGLTRTLAGSGVAGYWDGLGNEAVLRAPVGLTWDATGAVVISDAQNFRQRRATCSACPALSYCIAGKAFACPPGVWFNASAAAAGLSTPLCSGPCTAAPGWGCGVWSTSPWGSLCSPGFYCPGGAQPPIPCSCPSSCPTPGAVSDAGVLPLDGSSLVTWTVTPFAANGVLGFANGPMATAQVSGARGMSGRWDPSGGRVYLGDDSNARVRTLSPTGVLGVLAGEGIVGFVDGLGTIARFNRPMDADVDPTTGNVYVADLQNARIRKITPGGLTTTLAGSGAQSSVDGLGAAATFKFPHSLSVDPEGNFVAVVDMTGCVVRRIPLLGMPFVVTLAGQSSVCSFADSAVGTSALFNQPIGVAVSRTGMAYIADMNNHRIRAIVLATNAVSTLVGGATPGSADGIGTAATLNGPQAVRLDPRGEVLYVNDAGNYRVRRIVTSTGVVSTLAGGIVSTGPAFGLGPMASWGALGGISPATPGQLLIMDNLAQRVSVVTCSASTPPLPTPPGYWWAGMTYGVSPCPAGFFGAVAGLTNSTCSGPCTAAPGYGCPPASTSPAGVVCPSAFYCPGGSSPPLPCDCPSLCPGPAPRVANIASFWQGITVAGAYVTPGNADGAGSVARFGGARGLAVGPGGTKLYTTEDTPNNRVRVLNVVGGWGGAVTVSPLAGSATFGWADGTGSNAVFNRPLACTLHPSGSILYVADLVNNRIRAVTTGGGVVTTIAGVTAAGGVDGVGTAASFNWPYGIAIHPSGLTLLVADFNGRRVRSITLATAMVVTLAGNVGPSSYRDGYSGWVLMTQVMGLAFLPVPSSPNSAQIVYFADSTNNVVRSLNTSSTWVRTFGGSVTGVGGAADGASGTSTLLSGPAGVTVDNGGNVFVAMGPRLRRLAGFTGASTTIGTGVGGGGDGFGTSLTFNGLFGLGYDPMQGTVYAADTGGSTIRALTCAGVGGAGCPVGFYCVLSVNAGAPTPCPAGTWGGSPGLATPACSGNCSAAPGFGCYPGSTTPAGIQCLPGWWCPGGATPPQPCSCFSACPTRGAISDPACWWSVGTLAGGGGVGATNGVGTAATFGSLTDVAFGGVGGVWPAYAADFSNNLVRQIDSGGGVFTLAGSGVFLEADGVGAAAAFRNVQGVGGVLVNSSSAGGQGLGGNPPPTNPLLNSIFATDAGGATLRRITLPAATVSTLTATLANPADAAADMQFVYVSSQSQHSIRAWNASSGAMSVLAGSGTQGWADGGGGAAVRFNFPTFLALIPTSPLLAVCDSQNHVLRLISLLLTPQPSLAVIPTFPFSPLSPSWGLTRTLAGTPTSSGFADGFGSSAKFNLPSGLASDPGGVALFVGDAGNHRVRRVVVSTGLVTTLVGLGVPGWLDGPTSMALVNAPQGIAVHGTFGGLLLLCDKSNNRLRTITFNLGCPLGSWCGPGGIPPTLCQPGTFGNSTSATSAASGCAPCLAAPGWGCPAGSTSAAGEVCPIGFFCPGGATPPQPCACPFNCGSVGLVAGDGGGAAQWSVSTLGGNGLGTSLDAFSATSATFFNPLGVAVSPNSSFFNASTTTTATPSRLDTSFTVAVAEYGGRKIRTLYLNGSATPSSPLTAYNTQTLAGSGVYALTQGLGTAAAFMNPSSVAYSPSGTLLYVAEAGVGSVRVVTLRGMVSLLAGGAVGGFVEGVGGAARFANPCSCAADASLLYIADQSNHRIRSVTFAGVTSTVAGSGVVGFADGGPATAMFNFPTGVAVPAEALMGGGGVASKLYVVDSSNNRVRMVTLPSGVVSTLGGRGVSGWADGVGTLAVLFNRPNSVSAWVGGWLWVSDQSNHAIRQVSPTGVVTTIGGGGSSSPGYLDAFGTVSRFNSPGGVALSPPTSTVLVAGFLDNRLRALTCSPCPLGRFCTGGAPTLCPRGVFGDGSAGGLGSPACSGPCTAPPGNFCPPGSTNASGIPCPPGSACAGGALPPTPCLCPMACSLPGMANDPAVGVAGGGIWSVTTPVGSGAPVSAAGVGFGASFKGPTGLAWDGLGNGLLVASFMDSTLLSVNVGASGVGSKNGVAPVVKLAGTGVAGYANGLGNGGALINGPQGISPGLTPGTFFVCDYTGNRIRTLSGVNGSATGGVTVGLLAGSGSGVQADGVGAAAGIKTPSGLALDASSGTLYVSEETGYAIRAVTLSTAAVVRVAGTGVAGFGDASPGTSAAFNNPTALVLDTYPYSIPSPCAINPMGGGGGCWRLLVADWVNNRIRSIGPPPTYSVTTLAGSGSAATTDGTGTAAAFNGPRGIASDGLGNAFVTEWGGGSVRRLALGTTTVTTIAGQGWNAFGSSSAYATLPHPLTGVLYVSDFNYQRVRALTCSAGCPVGSFCPSTMGGASLLCPAGTWGGSPGLTNSTCSGNCSAAPGWGCGPGSTSPTGALCSPGYFCPGGAQPPTPCACPGVSPTGVLSDGCSAQGLVSDVSAGLPGGVTWSSATVVGGPGGTGNWDGPTPSATTHGRTIGPLGLAFSPDGTTLLHASLNGHNVRAIDVASWNMDSVGGQAVCGFVEGLGSVSRVCSPFGVVGDGLGGYYVAEAGNNRVRRLTPTPPSGPLGGTVGWLSSTFAGSGSTVGGDVDGVGTSAVIPGPVGLLLDGPTLYVVEEGGCTVRGVDTGSARVWGFVGEFGLCGFLEGVGTAALLSYPTSIALDRRGGGVNRLLIAECNNHRIRTVALGGGIEPATSTLLGNGVGATVDGVGGGASLKCPRGVVVDGGGWGFVSEFNGHTIRRFHLDTLVLTTLMGSPTGAAGYANGMSGGAMLFNQPLFLAIFPPTPALATAGSGARGGLLVSDFANNVIRTLTCTPCPSGGVYCPRASPPIPCPPGTWGGGPGLLTPACSGPCTAAPGFGCPAGSVNASGVVCPGGFFCPGGASPPIPCTCPSACPSGSALATDPTTSLVWTSSTLAGNGVNSYVDGVGTAAVVGSPFGLGVSRSTGNVYIGDGGGRHVRVVTPGGVVTTLAGTGALGGADGAGAVATFGSVESNCVDPSNTFLYVGETGAKVRRVTLPGGVVSTMVGTGVVGKRDGLGASALVSQPCGVACGANGNVWLLDVGQGNTVRMMTPSGALTTVAGGVAGFANGQGTNARFGGGWDLDVGPDNTVYVADQANHVIRMVSPTGYVSTLAGSGVQGWADGVGVAAMFSQPVGIAYHPSGTLITGDFSGAAAHKVRLINIASGAVMTIGGGVSGAGYVEGEGMDALFNAPVGVSIDLAGNVVVGDSANHRVRRLTCSVCPLGSWCVNGRSRLCSPGYYGNTSTNGATTCSGPCTAAEGWGCFAGSTSPMGTLCPPGWACLGGASPPRACTCRSACPNPGTLFEYSGAAWSVTTLAGSGVSGALNGVGTLATFSNPFGVVLVESTLYVTTGDNRLRAIALPSAAVTTFVGNGVAGSIDGVGIGASLNLPQSIFNFTSGNTTLLYLGEDLGDKIRAVSVPGGVTTTFAGTAVGYADGVGTTGSAFNQPTGVVVDPGTGMIFVSECTGNRVRRITPTGVVTTLSAGGFNCPWGIALGLTGQLFVGDMNTHRVKSVRLVGGLVSVVGGSGTAGWVDGVGSNALFTKPVGVLVDRVDSMLYVSEFAGGNRIRRIDPGGRVVTIMGSVSGASGLVNGLGTAALLNGPIIMAIDPSSQTLFVADRYNHVVRRLVCLPPTITPMPSPTPSASGGATVSLSGGTLTPSTSSSPSHSSTTSATTSVTLSGSVEVGTGSPTSAPSPTTTSSSSISGCGSGSPSQSAFNTVAPAGSSSPSASSGGGAGGGTASGSTSASSFGTSSGSGSGSGSGSATASNTPTPTTTLSPGASASVTPSGSPTATLSPTGSGTGSTTPSAQLASSSTSPTATATPTATPSLTSSPSSSLSPTASPTTTITTTPTSSLTIGGSASVTPSSSITPTPTETPTTTASSSTTVGLPSPNNPSTPSATLLPTPTPTPTTSILPSSTSTISPSPTASLSTGATPSGTGSDSTTGTPTPSSSGTGTGTASITPSTTLSGSTTISTSPTSSLTQGVSPSNTASNSNTASGTPPLTPTPTPTNTGTQSGSGTGSLTPSTTLTASSTVSASQTGSLTQGVSPSNTASKSLSGSVTPPPSPSPTSTGTPTSSGTGTASVTPSTTVSGSSTITESPTASISTGLSASNTGSNSLSSSSTGTQTPSPTSTETPTSSGTGTAFTTPSSTLSGSSTLSSSPTSSLTQGASPSTSGSASFSASFTPSITPTPTSSGTSTSSGTGTASISPSTTLSGSSTITVSPTASISNGLSASNTESISLSSSSTGTQTPTPSSTVSPTSSSTGTASITPSTTLSASSTLSSSQTPSLTKGASPSVSGSPSVSASVSSTGTPTSSSTGTPTSTGTGTSEVTPTSTLSGSSTVSSSQTPSLTKGASPSNTPSVSSSPSTSGTGSVSAMSTRTPTPSATPTPTFTPSSTVTESSTLSTSPTPSLSNGASPSNTPSLTPSSSVSATQSPTGTGTVTPTSTGTGTASGTVSASPTASLSRGASPSVTPSASSTLSASSAASLSGTGSNTPSTTPSPTSSLSIGASGSTTPSNTLTGSPTQTPTASVTQGASASTSSTGTLSASPSGTPTASLTIGISPSSTSTSTLSSSPTTTPTSSLSVGSSSSSTSTLTLTSSPTATPSSSLTLGASASTSSTSTLTASPSQTPTPSLSLGSSPSTTSTSSLSASPTSSPTPTITLGASASTTSTSTLSASPTSSPTPSLTQGGSPSSTSTRTLSGSPTQTPTPSLSSGLSPSTSSTATLSASPTTTPTSSLSVGLSPSTTSTSTLSGSPTSSPTPSLTWGGSPSSTSTSSLSGSPTQTPTSSITKGASPSTTSSSTLTGSPTITPTASLSKGSSPSVTSSNTLTGSPTTTPTTSATLGSSGSTTSTATLSASPTGTPSPTLSLGASPSTSSTATLSASPTSSPTPTLSLGSSPSTSSSATLSSSPSGTSTPTLSSGASPSSSSTRSLSPSPTASPTPTLSLGASPSTTTSLSSTPTSTPTPTPSLSIGASPSVTPTAQPSRAAATIATSNPSVTVGGQVVGGLAAAGAATAASAGLLSGSGLSFFLIGTGAIVGLSMLAGGVWMTMSRRRRKAAPLSSSSTPPHPGKLTFKGRGKGQGKLGGKGATAPPPPPPPGKPPKQAFVSYQAWAAANEQGFTSNPLWASKR